MLCLPNDVIINCILSHLYPSDLERCKDANEELKHIIENNEEYIDNICQHIQPHGERQTWYTNCNPSQSPRIMSQHNYKEGYLDGESKHWYVNGQLYLQVNYKEGKDHGEYKRWYGNGQLEIQCNYKEGTRHGELKYWYEGDGQLHIQTTYKEGKTTWRI